MKSIRKSHIAPLGCAVVLGLLLPVPTVAQQPSSQPPQEAAQTSAVVKQELKTTRLWLAPSQSSLSSMLERAARQALLHPDCGDVLYGGLNEFRSERTGTSFTILCMKDARSTFNQVFYLEDLTSDDDVVGTTGNPAAELERLRSMMQRQPADAPAAENPAESLVPVPETGNLPAPVVF